MSRKRQAWWPNQKESKASSFNFLSTNGTTSSAFASCSSETDETEDPKAKYYSKLKGLNVSVSDWIKQHVDKTPLCILSPIFKEYEIYLKEIQEEYGAPPQRSPSFQEQQHVPKTETPTEPQQRYATPPPQAHQPSPHPQPAPQPQQQAPSANDPIFKILNVQTDVLDIMTEVENFTGTKKDKRYIYLDEMLTRNLIKLDDIETDGKENIRQARKGAIKCIQKCIAALEAKAVRMGVSMG